MHSIDSILLAWNDIELAKSSNFKLEISPTLNALNKTTRKLQRVVHMILLFTSDHCAWCNVLKTMLDEESKDLGLYQPVFEVNVDRHHHIAEAYSILVVPTLVSGMQKISGVPSSSDLRSFILQVSTKGISSSKNTYSSSVLKEVRKIRDSKAPEEYLIRRA
jgi:thiol-disulfide isomerase/thioredoxin